MEFVKLELNQSYGNYSYRGESDEKMGILGLFLTDDVACHSISSWKEWALSDKWKNDETNGNITALERCGSYIFLKDLFSEEGIPTILKMTRDQFVQTLTDWEEKVCKLKPKEVIIKHVNDQFIIETKN